MTVSRVPIRQLSDTTTYLYKVDGVGEALAKIVDAPSSAERSVLALRFINVLYPPMQDSELLIRTTQPLSETKVGE